MTAVRPPEYWPRPIFFALADVAERMVLGDTLQYSRQSYQNRSPLRTPQGWQWISIPLAGRQHGRPIKGVRIAGRHRWIRKHWRALQYNYRTTPYFELYEPELADVFEKEWEVLGDLTCRTTELLARLLGIDTPIVQASKMAGCPDDVSTILERAGDEVLLTSAETAEADEGVAPKVHVLRLEGLRYRQNFDGFEPEMSVLDLLFNYGPETMSMIRRAVVREDAGAPIAE